MRQAQRENCNPVTTDHSNPAPDQQPGTRQKAQARPPAAEAPIPPGPVTHDQALAPPAPDQRYLPLLADVEASRRPERAWVRELFIVARVEKSDQLVGWLLYSYTDRHGLIDPAQWHPQNPPSVRHLIKRAGGISIATVTRALAELRRVGLYRSRRLSPGGPLIGEMAVIGRFRSPRTATLKGGGSAHGEPTPRLMVSPPDLYVEDVVKEHRPDPGRAAIAGTSREPPPPEDQQPDRSIPDGLISAIAGRSREHDVPFAEHAVRLRFARGQITTADLRRYLEDVLPPRMNAEDPEAVARWIADEAAGRTDRSRKGGYPAPPDDPRFTTEDPEDELDLAREQGQLQGLVDGRRAQARAGADECMAQIRRRFDLEPDPAAAPKSEAPEPALDAEYSVLEPPPAAAALEPEVDAEPAPRDLESFAPWPLDSPSHLEP